MASTNFFYGILIITFILDIILVLIYFLWVRKDHKDVLSTETIGCPIYTCPPTVANSPPTQAWRIEDGKKIIQPQAAAGYSKSS
jgi:hypothetical protein